MSVPAGDTITDSHAFWDKLPCVEGAYMSRWALLLGFDCPVTARSRIINRLL
jgi:hypothetical protein